MVKELFDMVEEHKFDMEHFSAKVTKEDITSKDSKVLSQKQANCLYNYFDFDLTKTLNYIKTHTYKDLSNSIGEILKELKG